MNKNRLFVIAALLLSGILFNNKAVFAWGTNGGDGSLYTQTQETAVFFNNSGGTRSQGDVVILDTARSGVVTDTTLGAYIAISDGTQAGQPRADSILAIGVVKSLTCADQKPCVVVTKGPALTTIADSSDAVSNFTAVGTAGSGTAAAAGGGTNLGIALEPGSGSDGDQIIVWVDPTGAD